MWDAESGTMASVLIVENKGGKVFIVEDKKSEPLEKILKTENSSSRSSRSLSKRKAVSRIMPREPSPIALKNEFEVEQDEEEVEMEISEDVVEEYLDEYFENVAQPVFVDPPIENSNYEDDIIFTIQEIEVDHKTVSEGKTEVLPEAILDHQYMVANYATDDENEDDESDEEQVVRVKVKIERKSGSLLPVVEEFPSKHKLRQLTGKAACKYCDTIFKSKESLKMHDCPYLQCNPKNFICRICKKELSRKTFSNHLHETLDCQYCGKQFVNPRNMKTHIKRTHKGEEFIPPNFPNRDFLDNPEERDEIEETSLDPSTGLMSVKLEPTRKRYPRKTGRFECDLCGRIFTTLRSLKIHMDLHTNNHRFICQICGEKYTTHTGISKHACLNKKRRRPMVDFRIYDVRHCKFCGLSFENLEDNKAHFCEYQYESSPKLFRCRFCSMIMSKNSYNKHMSRHVQPEKEYICSFCNKKLSDQVGLNIHLTTHTGNKPFKCVYENCEKSFINKQLLVRHSRFHGVEIPVYSCGICNKEVASKYHLKTHMKIHTDTFECQLCKTVFDGREALKEHYQDMHEPYQCDQCDKSFTLPRYLKMHEKLHLPSDPKPFKCEYCLSTSKAFGKVALLLNHIYKSHNENFAEWKENHPEIFKKF